MCYQLNLRFLVRVFSIGETIQKLKIGKPEATGNVFVNSKQERASG
jgi:hypothetical protein